MSLVHEVRKTLIRVAVPAALLTIAVTGPAAATPATSATPTTSAAPATSDSMRAEQKQLAAAAVEVGKTLDINLDFSHASVQKVDQILEMIHEEYALSHDDEGLQGLALEFGAYIVSTIERNSEPGVWHADDPEMGATTFPFRWRGQTLFPYGWCLKRILDDKSDSVWLKYREFVVKKLPVAAKRDSSASRRPVTKLAPASKPSR